MAIFSILEPKLTVQHYHLQCEGESNAVKLQMTANAIALMARSLSFDSEFMSPFSVSARRNNINATGESNKSISYILSVGALSISNHPTEWMSHSHTGTRHRLRFSSFVLFVFPWKNNRSIKTVRVAMVQSLMRIHLLNWLFFCREFPFALFCR